MAPGVDRRYAARLMPEPDRSGRDQDRTGNDPLLGRVVDGKFEIESLIGRGGMGAVYKARQKTLKRQVAIKVLRPELYDDSSYASRFKREASAASRLDHPNLMRVIDFGQDGELLYIAMELIDGRGLQAILREHDALPPEQIVDLMSQLLAALAAMHEGGIIHRDLKPENIMVVRGKDDDGQPIDVLKLCDFGIAKQVPVQNAEGNMTGVTHTATLTATGALVGTPEYMSPEQARGDDVDARGDVYAVGVMLFQMLTGRLPFRSANSMKVLLAHISEMPPLPHKILSTVDPRLEEICMRALAKDRDERFKDAREMRAAIRGVIGLRDSQVINGARRPSLLPPPSTPPPPKHAPDAETMAPEPSKTLRTSDGTLRAAVEASVDPELRRSSSGVVAKSSTKVPAAEPRRSDPPRASEPPRKPSDPPARARPQPAPADPSPTLVPPVAEGGNKTVSALVILIVLLLAVIAVLVLKK